MRFAFIHSERDAYPVTVLCRVMQVARSGYHAWAVREDCDRVREDRVLAVHVAAAFERSRRTYGSPRIRVDLQEDGMRVGRSRIARLMRENGLVARRKKAFRTTPDSCPSDRVSPNRLDRKFTARAPNRKWVTDVKYVRTSAGWLYLAPVIDLFSRRVVGCAMSTEQDGKLSVAALASALEARGNPRNVIVHSDRGGIYGDDEYVKKANANRLRRSMSRTRNPWDNAVIESFFSTLTHELLDHERYGSPDGAQRSIAEWIDDFYNTQRRHTSLGNMSPIKYELACQMRKRRT
jgi:putative transposase